MIYRLIIVTTLLISYSFGSNCLQDLKEFNPSFNVGGNTLLLTKIHEDLATQEKTIKERSTGDRASPNFVFAKIALHKKDGSVKFINIHDFVGPQGLPIVFSSCSNEGTVQEYCGQDFRYVDNYNPQIQIHDLLQISEGLKLEGQHEEAHYKIFELASTWQTQKDQLPDKIKDHARKIGAIKIPSQLQLVLEGKDKESISTRYIEELKINESRVQEVSTLQGELIQSQRVMDLNMSVILRTYWHSEIRLLSFLKKSAYLRGLIQGLSVAKSDINAITLHMHSTHDMCDNCRLQVTGAIYSWMYVLMSSFVENHPVFHVFVSYRLPYVNQNRTQKAKIRRDVEIKEIPIESLAQYSDIVTGTAKNPINDLKKPFLTIFPIEGGERAAPDDTPEHSLF